MQSSRDRDFASLNACIDSLKLSSDETRRIHDAFRDTEFLKLFDQYITDISSPKARAEQDAYLKQLEDEGRVEEVYGKDVELIISTPSFVLKSLCSRGMKVFINVCSCDKVDFLPQLVHLYTTQRILEALVGIFHSLWGRYTKLKTNIGLIHLRNLDLKEYRNACKVVDFIIHSNTLKKAQVDTSFSGILMETVRDALKDSYELRLNHEMTKIRSKYKPQEGNSGPRVLCLKRKHDQRADESQTDFQGGSTISMKKEDNRQLKEPTHTVKYVYNGECSSAWNDIGKTLHDISQKPKVFQKATKHIEFDKGLLVDIDLEGVTSMKDIDLEVSTKELKLYVRDQYQLGLSLPFEVEEEKGSAKFITKTSKLKISLPSKYPKEIQTSLSKNSAFSTIEKNEEMCKAYEDVSNGKLSQEQDGESIVFTNSFSPRAESKETNFDDSQPTENEIKWRQVHKQRSSVTHKKEDVIMVAKPFDLSTLNLEEHHQLHEID